MRQGQGRGRGRGRGLVLAAALTATAWITLDTPAAAGGRGGSRKQLKWNNFRPKGLGWRAVD